MESNEQSSSLRDSLNRWNAGRAQQGSSVNEGAKTLLAGWAESLNARAADVYQRLPLTQQDLVQSPEPAWFALSRTERLALFVVFLAAAAGCFAACVMLFPVLALKPRKFGLLWPVGSLLFVLAFGVLQGPVAYAKHMLSRERLPFTAFFLTTCAATIYFAAIAKSTLLTIPCALLQLVAVVYYGVSYFPFGAAGLRMVSAAGLSTARGALRI
ncbi:ADR066Cp [Eremothecium gossypii ATCC 10895]|uniref:Protein transport protein SFT2 n=1 Tax=Eremothecium gossypii (strain ATCC 10895 / CBS 109.51 / FGSC 9923 / NRRL Y-1056) TaxID=284811 RepID=Q75A53_EREGS|nr:ADR066Cp [Eremothecium gossypii ATCC 10895]AAS51986.2 ADR066Cp [Eremothecium gossypii ATCC 10895]